MTEAENYQDKSDQPGGGTARRTGWYFVIALAILIVVAGILWIKPGSNMTFTPGAAGAGDPYFPQMGNGGYDVSHYDVALTYTTNTRAINAVVKIDAAATQNLSRFNLDFRQPLQVDKVTVDGQPATYTRDGIQELVVTPKDGLPSGHAFNVEVAYSGRPQDIYKYGPNGWIETSDGVISMPQPNGTETWMPNNGTPTDKATYDFAVTVPKELQVIANGEPAGTTTKDDQTTYKWHDANQTPGELVLLAIGKFNVKDTKTSNGIRNITAIDPEAIVGDVAQANDAFNQRTAEVMDWAQKLYGKYPYTSTGGVQDLGEDIGFSEEMVTRSAYVHGAGTIPSTAIIAHEITHQYYGNSVTPKTWGDVWLNEGFATYGEWLYDEQHGGMTAQAHFDELYNDPATDWTNKVGTPGTEHFFDDLVYQRGAMAVHMLRKTLGDEQFFQLLKSWPTTHKDGVASVQDYIAYAKKVAPDKPLDKLFQTWLFSEGKPAL